MSSCDWCLSSRRAGGSGANETVILEAARVATIEPHLVPVQAQRSKRCTEALKKAVSMLAD